MSQPPGVDWGRFIQAFNDITREMNTSTWEALRGAFMPAVLAVHEAEGHTWTPERPLGHLVTYPRCTVCRKWEQPPP